MFSAAQEHVSQAASPVGAPRAPRIPLAGRQARGLPLTLAAMVKCPADLSATLRRLPDVVSSGRPLLTDFRAHQRSDFASSRTGVPFPVVASDEQHL
jgi:hypothetical protein